MLPSVKTDLTTFIASSISNVFVRGKSSAELNLAVNKNAFKNVVKINIFDNDYVIEGNSI